METSDGWPGGSGKCRRCSQAPEGCHSVRAPRLPRLPALILPNAIFYSVARASTQTRCCSSCQGGFLSSPEDWKAITRRCFQSYFAIESRGNAYDEWLVSSPPLLGPRTSLFYVSHPQRFGEFPVSDRPFTRLSAVALLSFSLASSAHPKSLLRTLMPAPASSATIPA